MKQALVLVLGIACLALLLAGCKGDEGPMGPAGPAAEPQAYFALTASPQTLTDEQGEIVGEVLFVSFTMSLQDMVPLVTVNGVSIESFSIYDSVFYGWIELQNTDSIVWEVRRGNQVINGTLTAPTTPTGFTCNGVEIVPGDNWIDQAEGYAIAWTGGSYDYCFGYYYTYSGPWYYRTFSTAESEITLSVVDVFYHNPGNGVHLVPGASPNATSSWASGFVNFSGSSSVFRFYHGDPKANRTALEPNQAHSSDFHRRPLHERLAEFLKHAEQ